MVDTIYTITNYHMGIKNLNRYLTNNCNEHAIKKVHLSAFSDKKIAIDASIYMYRFIGENKLIEHMYLMISIFTHYKITPVFIFDGISPPEKKELLDERKENKRIAEEKYESIKQQLANSADEEKYEIISEMEKLKKQFIHIKHADYKSVKTILNTCGITWIDAPGEADELCAHLMHTEQVYACLSEDMDMFAYGCCRIMRHLSLAKHNVLFYDLTEILVQLKMNLHEFRQVVILSGTDYNKEDTTNLDDSFTWFKAYKKNTILIEENVPSFYEWLLKHTDYIKNPDGLKIAYQMFDIKKKQIEFNCSIENKKTNKEQLIQFLDQDGFIFV
jgi:5'-3' exonuclease